MKKSGSSSRKRSSNHIGSSDDPVNRSLIQFFPPEPKRGRIEYTTMESISGNCTIPATDHDHEEWNLDLSLQLGLSRTVQNQRAQIQAEWEAVRAELERAQHENRLLTEKLSEANAANKALQDRYPELLLDHINPDEKGEDEQGGAAVSPSSSSPSNPDQTDPIVKDPQVSVRIRTEQPVFDDGCRWRKYGKKLSKGNPFPRAYYRCSLDTDCSVHKKVQRCAEDPTAWTLTYKGSHNHVLPPAAVARANATSAAMSMLMSGSLFSASAISNNSTVLAGATISIAEPYPTVMMDYTRPPAAVAGISELTKVIFSDPRVNAAVVSAITASSAAPKGDGDSKENGKKE